MGALDQDRHYAARHPQRAKTPAPKVRLFQMAARFTQDPRFHMAVTHISKCHNVVGGSNRPTAAPMAGVADAHVGLIIKRHIPDTIIYFVPYSGGNLITNKLPHDFRAFQAAEVHVVRRQHAPTRLQAFGDCLFAALKRLGSATCGSHNRGKRNRLCRCHALMDDARSQPRRALSPITMVSYCFRKPTYSGS
jgi:hypothetical protein